MNAAKKVLLVDDDASFLESNRDLFEAYGYEVHTATNGQDGLATARRVRPDVMILDVMMATDTEGFEVARQVREVPELRQVPIVLVTGVVKALHLPRALQADLDWLPVDRILEKPVDPLHLLGEVERVLTNPPHR